jgi:hypothetical protein
MITQPVESLRRMMIEAAAPEQISDLGDTKR